jgi:hypothetical protein
VAGFSYAPRAPEGSCTNEICLVDAGTGAMIGLGAAALAAAASRRCPSAR